MWPFASESQFISHNTQVRGRFAPSPSGPLHFGSLVAALGSYIHAKANDGLWFVRIEDIDTTRVVDGAEAQIFEALSAFGFEWDLPTSGTFIEPNKCVKQTERIKRYQTILDYLVDQNIVYGCECTRKQIKAMGGVYDQTCINKQLDINANPIRLKQTNPVYQFEDGLFGVQECPAEMAQEDYIIKRRDGLFSYQLAVVVDDIDQGITHIVRGADIMPLTARQIALYQTFNVPAPKYIHLPLAVTGPGQKLSKQNHATAININNPLPELLSALAFLGFEPDYLKQQVELSNGLACKRLLDVAIATAKAHWRDLESLKLALPRQLEITI